MGVVTLLPQSRPLTAADLVPSVTAWQLRGGTYVELGHVEGDGSLAIALPFAITLTPGDLLG